MNRRLRFFVSAVLAVAGVFPAFGSIVFSASNGNLAASVEFEISGNSLFVTLTNTASSPALVPADSLTGVFFDWSGNPSLTQQTAVLAGTSSVLFPPSGDGTDGGNLGGEWAFESGLSGAPHDASYGISSSGLDLFGDANFTGANLQGPDAVNGMQYGIVPASGTTGGNPPMTNGSSAFISNAVLFSFDITGLDLDLDDISNVSFQYGTSLSEPNLTIVPEPATLSLIGLGLSGLALQRWCRRKHVS
jgi:hypothetical protein